VRKRAIVKAAQKGRPVEEFVPTVAEEVTVAIEATILKAMVISGHEGEGEEGAEGGRGHRLFAPPPQPPPECCSGLVL